MDNNNINLKKFFQYFPEC